MSSIDAVYNTAVLNNAQRSRFAQLEALYGFPFPTELFVFWGWYQALSDTQRETLVETLAMNPVGPFDVLAGEFDNFEPGYPTVLHWRYQYDPPEFVTVFVGDTGLHWGLWFDDHHSLAPVVASYYANDAFELTETGDGLFDAVRQRMEDLRISHREDMIDVPEYKSEYIADLVAIDVLEGTLPLPQGNPGRVHAMPTDEGMGVVMPDQAPESVRKQLLLGKKMWIEDPRKAGPVLKAAYLAAKRPILASIVEAHTITNPVLPNLDVLNSPRGTFYDLERALAFPTEVKILGLPEAKLEVLPDLSSMTNLEELMIYGNNLTELPRSLKSCTKLREINLFRNPLKHVPAVLHEIPALELVIFGDGVPEEEMAKLREVLPNAEVR